MSRGPVALEQRIEHFERLLADMRAETREAHSTLKEIRNVRREVERLLSTDVKEMVDRRVDEVVEKELARIGPELREQTNAIYAKVGQQVDKLIDISLGKEFSSVNGREDLRPRLAAHLREWLREVLAEGDEP